MAKALTFSVGIPSDNQADFLEATLRSRHTISRLQGDRIPLFSSDDIAHPNFVETLPAGASRHDDAVLVHAGWETIDKGSKTLGKQYLLRAKPGVLPHDGKKLVRPLTQKMQDVLRRN